MKFTIFILLIIMSCSPQKRELNNNDVINFNIIENDFHKDLKVSIPTNKFELITDSYYFNLDNSIKTTQGYEKVRYGIGKLLGNWILNLNSLKKDSVIYLPIDFSDEYIGGFRTELINQNSIKLSYGISEDLGSGVFPSNPKSFLKSPTNFQTDDKSIELIVNKDKFIKAIEQNIIRIK